MTRALPSLAAVLLCVLHGGGLQAAGYRFLLPTIQAKAGDSVRFTIRGEHEQSAQGFSLAARYPSSQVTIERIHIEDTILEAINIDFFETKVSAESGLFAVGILVDSKPPFDGNLIPNIGRPLDFVHMELKIAQGASGALKIKLENGLFSPVIDNLYSVNNQAIFVTELTEGQINIGSGQGGGGGFYRGDFNMDARIDISDPIGMLAYTFLGGAKPLCMVAADSNDDDTFDLSDPVFVLNYLFFKGPPMPPPSHALGGDPTPGELGCENPMEL